MLLMANNGYEWRKRRAFLNNFWLFWRQAQLTLGYAIMNGEF